ncbi:hypothetical protein [Cupriavidus sp. UYPR2.512]|nr:hypothetical protein [Cupriavidus sp. UYPR2.512]
MGDSVYMLTAPNRYPTLATRTLMDFIRLHLERQAELGAPQPACGSAQ